MTPEEVAKLRPGLYLIFWKDGVGGGTSHAAVGVGIPADLKRGLVSDRWIAPVEGVAAPAASVDRWDFVREVQPLTGPDAKEPLDALEAVRDRLSRIRALAVSESEPRAKDKIAALVDELGLEVQKRATRTTRERVLERLLYATWRAIPDFLSDDNLSTEHDGPMLRRLTGLVGDILDGMSLEPPLEQFLLENGYELPEDPDAEDEEPAEAPAGGDPS